MKILSPAPPIVRPLEFNADSQTICSDAAASRLVDMATAPLRPKRRQQGLDYTVAHTAIREWAGLELVGTEQGTDLLRTVKGQLRSRIGHDPETCAILYLVLDEELDRWDALKRNLGLP